MRIVALFLFCFIHLSAVTPLSLYEEQGTFALLKSIDNNLSRQSYWRHELLHHDLRFGYYSSSIKHLFICDKNVKQLTHYEKNATNHFELKRAIEVLMGKQQGQKMVEGDNKTPVGTYQLTHKLHHLDKKYGPMAFSLSYPNSADKFKSRTGHGIWLHGLPEANSSKAFTKGCLAIDNQQLIELNSTIALNNTILIIEEANQSSATLDTYSNILASLHEWRHDWRDNHLTHYLSFYNQDVKFSSFQSFQQFKHHKTRLFKQKRKKIIDFTNIVITPIFQQPKRNDYLITFNELFLSNNFMFQGEKSLYIVADEKQFSILYEE